MLNLLEFRGGPEFAVKIIFQHFTDFSDSCVQDLSLFRLMQVTRIGFGVGWYSVKSFRRRSGENIVLVLVV